MTEQEDLAAAETRLAQLFAKCELNPDGEHHTWNFSAKQCVHCEAPWPYPEYAR